MHYKQIRRGLKGWFVAPWTKTWLTQVRRTEMALEEQLAPQIKEAKQNGCCPALVMPMAEVATDYGVRPGRDGKVCGRPAFKRGYCRSHFFSHVLYVKDPQSDRAGAGVTRRPFTASQLPVGRMSEVQFDLMNDLLKLPMFTELEECLRVLSEADPTHPLDPIKK
jgi:hypothetical protein